MKLEQMVIGGGLAFVIGLSVVAIVADDLWEDEYHDAPAIPAGIRAPHHDGREKIACNSCHVILAGKTGDAVREERRAGKGAGMANAGVVPPIALGSVVPVSHKDGRNTMVCQNCHEILPRGTRVPRP
jgi:hypothetical protein